MHFNSKLDLDLKSLKKVDPLDTQGKRGLTDGARVTVWIGSNRYMGQNIKVMQL